MSLALDELPRDPDRLLQIVQQMAEVVARQNASLVSLRAEHDTALAERDGAQAEVEKLRLLIRQLQRNASSAAATGGPAFVPVLVAEDSAAPAEVPGRIEIALGPAVVRVGTDVDAAALRRVLEVVRGLA